MTVGGKTTLLTDWLAARSAGGPLAVRLSLDDRDTDPVLFWTYVAAALQRVVADDVGTGALALLESPAPPFDVLATLLNELDTISDDVALVLDDHHVIDASRARRHGVPA